MTGAEAAHFVAAKRHSALLLGAGAAFGAVGVVLVAMALFGGSSLLPTSVAAGALGSACLVAGTGVLCAAFVAVARQRLLQAGREALEPAAEAALRAWAGRIAGWPQTVVAFGGALVALAGAALAPWSVSLGTAADGSTSLVAGGALVLAAFPVLVLERHIAGLAPAELPEAGPLAHLLRVPLIALLGCGIVAAMSAEGFRWLAILTIPIRLLSLAVALELAARAAATVFLPAPPRDQPRLLARSALADLLRPRQAGLRAIGGTIEQQFGINLARSWALGFVRRALPPVALGMALLAWGLTGLTALRLDERAVYERLGVPVAVLGPGLHAHLPWPAGTIRRVELGVVHDIPIVFGASSGSADAGQSAAIAAPPGAEDVPPITADRLWDQSHPSEATYLIASEARGRQSFQIVNIDLRVVYRVGLSDADARAAAYRVADPERLLRSIAGRVLARYFAGRTLLGILGEDRETVTAELRANLAHELDAYTTGLEVLAVVVEAIHPPPGAAGAYHDVQAAGIRAQTAIADQRGGAALSASQAEQTATAARDAAATTAARLVAEAETQNRLFVSDRIAAQRNGPAFLLERWLDRVQRGLAHRQMVVVDHRLERDNAPTLDLRSFAPPAAATTP